MGTLDRGPLQTDVNGQRWCRALGQYELRVGIQFLKQSCYHLLRIQSCWNTLSGFNIKRGWRNISHSDSNLVRASRCDRWAASRPSVLCLRNASSRASPAPLTHPPSPGVPAPATRTRPPGRSGAPRGPRQSLGRKAAPSHRSVHGVHGAREGTVVSGSSGRGRDGWRFITWAADLPLAPGAPERGSRLCGGGGRETGSAGGTASSPHALLSQRPVRNWPRQGGPGAGC